MPPVSELRRDLGKTEEPPTVSSFHLPTEEEWEAYWKKEVSTLITQDHGEEQEEEFEESEDDISMFVSLLNRAHELLSCFQQIASPAEDLVVADLLLDIEECVAEYTNLEQTT